MPVKDRLDKGQDPTRDKWAKSIQSIVYIYSHHADDRRWPPGHSIPYSASTHWGNRLLCLPLTGAHFTTTELPGE